MTPDQRRAMLDEFGGAYEHVRSFLATVPPEVHAFKPASDRWSIHEILVHLGDSEANAFIRFRRCLAEPGTTLSVYDQDKWTASLGYANQNADDALALFRSLRLATFNLLRLIPDSSWSLQVNHPERGIITLDDILNIYTDHISGHIHQMQNNLAAWKTQQG